MAAAAISKKRAKYLTSEPVRVSPEDDGDGDNGGPDDDGSPPQRRVHIKDVGRAAAFVSAVQTSASQVKTVARRQNFVRTTSQVLSATAMRKRQLDVEVRKRERRETKHMVVHALQGFSALVHIIVEPYSLAFKDHSTLVYAVGYFVDAINVVCCLVELRWIRWELKDMSSMESAAEVEKLRLRRKYLVVETCAVLPIDLVLWFGPSTAVAIPYVRLTRLVQCQRLSRYLGHLLVSVKVSYTKGQLIFSLVIFFWLTHWVACAMYLAGGGESATYFSVAAFIKRHVSGGDDDDVDGGNSDIADMSSAERADAYMAVLYWAIGAVYRNGNMDPTVAVEIGESWELLLSLLIDSCAFLMNTYMVAIVTIVLLRNQTTVDTYREKVATIDAYLRKQRVRPSLRTSCLDYFRHTFEVQQQGGASEVDEALLLSKLPRSLRAEITCDMFMPILSETQLFRGLEYTFVAAVCHVLRRATFLKGETLCKEHEFQRQLHVIESGFVSKVVTTRGVSSADALVVTLRVHLLSATGLRPADKNGLSDPYVKLSAAGQSVQSRIVSRTLDPVWDQELELMGPAAAFRKEGLTLEVFDSDKLSRDDSLGFVRIELSGLDDGVPRDHHEFLRSKSDATVGDEEVSGTLRFSVTLTTWHSVEATHDDLLDGTVVLPPEPPAAHTATQTAAGTAKTQPSTMAVAAAAAFGGGAASGKEASRGKPCTVACGNQPPSSSTSEKGGGSRVGGGGGTSVHDGASTVDEAENPVLRLPVGARRMRMSRGAMPNAAAFVANLRQPTTVRAESRTSCLELARADFMHLLGDFEEVAAELKARLLQVRRSMR